MVIIDLRLSFASLEWILSVDIYAITIAQFEALAAMPTGTSDDQVHRLWKLAELRRKLEEHMNHVVQADELTQDQVDALIG